MREAQLEAEIDRLGQEVERLTREVEARRMVAVQALALVREAGDCLLLSRPGDARERIAQASVLLLRAGGRDTAERPIPAYGSCAPEDDPNRSPEDRAAWRAAGRIPKAAKVGVA